MVKPSGFAWLAMKFNGGTPWPPGMFSITIVGLHGRYLVRYAPISRAARSVLPPVVVGTIILMVLPAKETVSSADAGPTSVTDIAAAAAIAIIGNFIGSFLPVVFRFGGYITPLAAARQDSMLAILPCRKPSALKLFDSFRREITQHAVGSRALTGDKAFHHSLVAVDPAIRRRGHNHRIFAGHLVNEGRHAESVLQAANNIEIGQARFHHDHVRAFGDIQFGFAQRLLGIAGVHLIGSLVASQGGAGADGIAERSVEG